MFTKQENRKKHSAFRGAIYEHFYQHCYRYTYEYAIYSAQVGPDSFIPPSAGSRRRRGTNRILPFDSIHVSSLANSSPITLVPRDQMQNLVEMQTQSNVIVDDAIESRLSASSHNSISNLYLETGLDDPLTRISFFPSQDFVQTTLLMLQRMDPGA